MKDKYTPCCSWVGYTWLVFGILYVLQTWLAPNMVWFSKIFPWDAMLFVLIGLTLMKK